MKTSFSCGGYVQNISESIHVFQDGQNSSRIISRTKWMVWMLGASIVGGFAMIANTSIKYFDYKSTISPVSVYFDIRAIDPSGHPTTGADVRINGELVGVTDSFGDWRRYMQLTPQSSFVLKVEKTEEGRQLEISKNLVVPQSQQREVTIKQMIQLRSTVDIKNPKSDIQPQNNVKDELVAIQETSIEISTLGAAKSDERQKIHKQLTSYVETLKASNFAKDLHLTNLKFSLLDLNEPMVAVDARWTDGFETRILRAVLDDDSIMTKQLSESLVAAKNIQTQSPKSGWAAVPVKFTGRQDPINRSIQVFVGGFPVWVDTKTKVEKAWIPKSHDVYLTQVEGSRVMRRQKISAKTLAPGEAIIVKLAPVSNLAKFSSTRVKVDAAL